MSQPEVRRLKRNDVHYYFDAHESPRLSVRPGTRVTLETEDANRGAIRHEQDAPSSLDAVLDSLGGANPVTGPIYVEGARVGDTLAVTIEAIEVAPVWRYGYTSLIPGLGGLVSNYVLQEPLPPRVVISEVDSQFVQVPLKNRKIRIPTHPFIGTIGVAPRGARQLSLLQGVEFLGNCDIPEACVGNTVVLPVNVEGGLLSLGDVHAAQGDGEICGVAVEIQADVDITIDLISHHEAEFVRLPQINSEHWIGSVAAFGGVNLGDTVRAAYCDLIQRMVRFYGFTTAEAYILVSQTGRVRIGQVVDPLYSALVSIERRYLD